MCIAEGRFGLSHCATDYSGMGCGRKAESSARRRAAMTTSRQKSSAKQFHLLRHEPKRLSLLLFVQVVDHAPSPDHSDYPIANAVKAKSS
jgi:hypothetical protein